MGVPFPPLGSPRGTLIFWGFEIHPYFEVFIKTLPCFPWVWGGPKGNVDEILLRIHRYTICSCNIIYIYVCICISSGWPDVVNVSLIYTMSVYMQIEKNEFRVIIHTYGLCEHLTTSEISNH